MTNEKQYYIREKAKTHNVRFLRCDGVIYEGYLCHHLCGRDWIVEEVIPLDIPSFTDADD